MRNLVVALAIPMLTGTINFAQISEGGFPASFQTERFSNPEIFETSYQVHQLTSPDMDVVKLLSHRPC
jgi:hypothetical protein